MSKIQTKINFLEKKKTSARLQEKLKKNEVKPICKQKTEFCEIGEKSYNKENELKVKLLTSRRNPTVLIYRSPLRSEKVKDILIENGAPGITESPSKRNVKPTKRIYEEFNTVESKESNTKDKDPSFVRSPLKEKPVVSESPTKDKRDYNLRQSPLKKSPLKRLSLFTEESNTNEKGSDFVWSPSKEKPTVSETPTKDSRDYNFRQSPLKKSQLERVSLFAEVSNEKDSNLVKSPFKEKSVTTESPTKEKRDYNLRQSPMKKTPLKRASPSKTVFKGEESSPPKQKCVEGETPSLLLTKLALESPERKQNVRSRKELFPKGEFDEACKALHSSAPIKLPGREDKLEFIKEFLLKHSAEQSSGSLYISGPPGTGKTASINLAISYPKIVEQYKVICLNCTSLTSSGSIYSRIVGELKLKPLGHSEKAALTAIEKHLESIKRKMILIILDELDQLCSTKQSVLYSVFEWPARKNARLVLIGIANALDLTDRVLPRLQAHLALQPTVLHFPSYTRQQIINIIADRLSQAGVEAVFSGPTLQLLAGKVAAVNGDVRRALDIARRVVEVAEKRTVLQQLPESGSSRQTVALQEVMAVINDVYSTAQSLDSSESDSFPLQQKLLICSLLLIRQTSKTRDITVGKLHEVYKKVCERRNLSALDMTEFISLMPLVEARGILRVTGKTHNRQSKVVLQWDEGEVKNTLKDKQLLAAVLSDKGIV